MAMVIAKQEVIGNVRFLPKAALPAKAACWFSHLKHLIIGSAWNLIVGGNFILFDTLSDRFWDH